MSKIKDWIKQRNWNSLERTFGAAVFAFLFGLFLAINSPGNEASFDHVFSVAALVYATLAVLELWSGGRNVIEALLSSWVYFGYGAVYGAKGFNQHHYALVVSAAWFLWNLDWKRVRESLKDFRFARPVEPNAPKPPKEEAKPLFHWPEFKFLKTALSKIGKKPQEAEKPTPPAPAAPTPQGQQPQGTQGQKNPAPSGSDQKGNNGNKGNQPTQQTQPTGPTKAPTGAPAGNQQAQTPAKSN